MAITLNAGSGGSDIHTVTDAASGDEVQVIALQDEGGDSLVVSAAGAASVEVTAALPAGTNTVGSIEGVDAEDAAVTADPLLVGGRYDATARSLDDGDAGALALDPNGALLVSNHSIQSPTSGGNSSTTPLAGSATFTGTGEQNEHPDVMVSCLADQTGTLYFDFSVDGSNWNTFPTAGFTLAANTHEFHTAVKGPRYFRVRLVNDGTPQTTLRLYTYYGTFAGKPNAPIGQSVNDDSDATTVKAVIVGDSGGGSYVNVGVTSGGNFKVDLEDLGGNAIAAGAGNSDTGTQRVVIATDDTNLSGILADTAAMDTNLATLAGAVTAAQMQVDIAAQSVSPLVVTDDGTAILVDGSAVTQPVSGTVNIGTFPDNEPFNVAQMGGTAVSMNTGVRDAGTQRVTIATNDVVPASQSGTWNITNVSGTVSLPTGAATAANQLADGHNVTVDNVAGTNSVPVAGDQAHSSTTVPNPVVTGARASNAISGVTQVANADTTYLQADLNGVLITRPHTTLEEIITERVADTAGNSTNFTNFSAGAAGVHNYVTTIAIFNSSATDGYVDFRDGSAGSIIFTAPAPAAGGSVITFPVPLKGAAATALAYDVSGALTTVYISVIGFKAQG